LAGTTPRALLLLLLEPPAPTNMTNSVCITRSTRSHFLLRTWLATTLRLKNTCLKHLSTVTCCIPRPCFSILHSRTARLLSWTPCAARAVSVVLAAAGSQAPQLPVRVCSQLDWPWSVVLCLPAGPPCSA